MKSAILMVFLIVQSALCFADYPNLELIKGQVLITGVDNKPAPAKSGQVLRQTAIIEVGENSLVVIALSPNSKLTLFDATLLRLPEINYESGDVELLFLERGKFRYFAKDNKSRTLETKIFRESLKPGDYVFWMNPAIPKVEVLLIEGELSFRGLENEKSHQLKSAQKSAFVGQLENGDVAYDELLRGRKIARGSLSEVSTATDAELKPYREMDEIRKAKAEQAKKVVKRLPDQICEKPFAKLDQCVYRLLKGKCYRERCNANGLWSEKTELHGRQAKCVKIVSIESCDY